MRLIDAEPIAKFIKDGLNNPNKDEAFGYTAVQILAEIEYAPTVDAVEVVHGEWTGSRFDTHGDHIEKCSACQSWSKAYGHDYCPSCGAKMDGGNEDG